MRGIRTTVPWLLTLDKKTRIRTVVTNKEMLAITALQFQTWTKRIRTRTALEMPVMTILITMEPKIVLTTVQEHQIHHKETAIGTGLEMNVTTVHVFPIQTKRIVTGIWWEMLAIVILIVIGMNIH